MIDFYDNDKYIPYIEQFFGKPFDEIYGDLIDKMNFRIEKIKLNKKKV